MNIQTDTKYGNYVNSEIFGCTFFLIPFYSEKYKMMQYSLFSAPTFEDNSVDWDRQVSITEWNTDDLEKEQHKEIADCWQALMKEVV
mgnify:CR=1 FL=1